MKKKKGGLRRGQASCIGGLRWRVWGEGLGAWDGGGGSEVEGLRWKAWDGGLRWRPEIWGLRCRVWDKGPEVEKTFQTLFALQLVYHEGPTSAWQLPMWEEGGYSQKTWVGMCGMLPKTFTLFMTEICDFAPLFKTWAKIWYPFYDHCG